MELLINPNVGYLLFIAAFLLMLVSIIAPGTGAPEAAFVLCVMAASYFAFQLGINLWAVVILGASVVPFWIALRRRALRIPLVIISVLLLIGGSLFLFTGKDGLPLVNPALAVIVSLVSGGLVWLSADRAATVMHQAPVHDPDALIGQIGQARTHIHAEGSVQIGGELWSACSEKPIATKSLVRVIRREGLILTVEEEPK